MLDSGKRDWRQVGVYVVCNPVPWLQLVEHVAVRDELKKGLVCEVQPLPIVVALLVFGESQTVDELMKS